MSKYHDGVPSYDDSSPIYKDAGRVEAEEPEHHVVADRLARRLSARQVQLIAIGGTIGTGLFLGTGKSLATGGPASMLISYCIVGVIVFCTMMALGEMAVSLAKPPDLHALRSARGMKWSNRYN